jgi:hypothetical protein
VSEDDISKLKIYLSELVAISGHARAFKELAAWAERWNIPAIMVRELGDFIRSQQRKAAV